MEYSVCAPPPVRPTPAGTKDVPQFNPARMMELSEGLRCEGLHYDSGRPYGDLWAEDAGALAPLPGTEFIVRKRETAKADAYGRIVLDDGRHVHDLCNVHAGKQVIVVLKAWASPHIERICVLMDINTNVDCPLHKVNFLSHAVSTLLFLPEPVSCRIRNFAN